MLMVVESWPGLPPGGKWPSQDMVACFSAEQTVSLRALQSSSLSHKANYLRYFYLFLCPLQGLENQEVGLLSESWKTQLLTMSVSAHQQNLTSLLEEFQLEQLAVETFPVEVSFSLSFLLASRRAAATSMVCCEPGPR